MAKLDNKKVLWVEDDIFIGEMIARRLKVAGADYVWAKNGEEGLQKVQSEYFDVVITDLMMAKMDGQEMIRNMKSNEKTKNIPVIVLTNLTGSSSGTQDLETLGVDAWFIKSNTSLGDFVDQVADILNKKSV